MLAKRKNKWLVLALSLGLLLAACGDETAAEGNDEDEADLPTNADVQAPLENLETLTDGAPDNDTLPEEAKADEIFPAQFDVVDTQSPVSSQGSRGVCSVFSTVALMEHLYIKEGTKTDPQFSEQYLQWSAKFEVGSFPNSSGSNANFNLQAISDYGIVTEEVWPYETSQWGAQDDPECTGEESEQPTRCFTNGEPPAQAENAPKYQLPRGRWISTRTRDIKAHIYNNEKGVVVGGDFYYQSWNHSASTLPTNQDYWREGYVLYPNQDDLDASQENPAGHSILLVGWDDDLEVERVDGEGEVITDEDGNPETEKGFFIFKNSWGTGSFGVNNEHGDGYGYISYDYVQRFKSGRVAGTPEPHHIPDPADGDELECSDDELECDGQCVVEGEDNCGSCGNVCASGQVCAESVCVEHEGELDIFSYDGSEQAIPDYDPDDGPGSVTLDLEVQGSGVIQELFVDVEVEHTYNGDVQLELIHPNGAEVEIREADGTPGHDVSIVDQEVADFIGEESEGVWQLRASDHARFDEGSVQSWSLSIVR